MLPLERRNWIENQISQYGKIDIEKAAKALAVSPMTIRRDLRELESEGKVVRTHGGAVAAQALTTEVPYSSKETQHIIEKKKIARKAVSLVKDHSTIILDSGTTTFEVARLLKAREDLTIVTNDIKIASELMDSSNKVIVTGGEVQREIGALFGPATQEILRVIHADLFFLGAHAVNLENGVTAPTFEKSVIKQMMMNAAKTTWLLADHSKFDKIAFSRVCQLKDLEGVVTDSNLTPSTIEDYGSHIPILVGGDAL